MKSSLIIKILVVITIISVSIIITYNILSSPNLKPVIVNNIDDFNNESSSKQTSSKTQSSKTNSIKSTSSKKTSSTTKKSSSYSSKLTNSKPTSSDTPSEDLTQELYFNINTVTLDELVLIDSIGTKTAQAIIDFRNQIGSFESIDELQMVPGVGNQRFETLKQYLYCE